MTATLAHSHGTPTGSPAERFTSRNPEDFPPPTTSQEDWRFSPPRKLRGVFEPPAPAGTERGTVDAPPRARSQIVGRDHPPLGAAAPPSDRVAALAMAGVEQVLLIEVDADAQLERPVVIDVEGQPGANYGHVIVHAARFSEATIVFRHYGETRDAANVEFVLDDGARLSV